jgi:hypothetical protein
MMPPRKGDDLYDMPRAPGVPPRWHVLAYYRTPEGVIDVEYMIEEIDMLYDIVERGPDWHTLDRIEIRLTDNPTPNLTI